MVWDRMFELVCQASSWPWGFTGNRECPALPGRIVRSGGREGGKWPGDRSFFQPLKNVKTIHRSQAIQKLSGTDVAHGPWLACDCMSIQPAINLKPFRPVAGAHLPIGRRGREKRCYHPTVLKPPGGRTVLEIWCWPPPLYPLLFLFLEGGRLTWWQV